MKHTSGPWIYSGLLPASVGARNGSVAIVAEVGGSTDGECAANARLIAAAPDLLEACKSILRDYGYDSSIRRQLGDVIAKAEGA